MTRFLSPKFTVGGTGDPSKFAEGWERTFGEKKREPVRCSCGHTVNQHLETGHFPCEKCACLHYTEAPREERSL